MNTARTLRNAWIAGALALGLAACAQDRRTAAFLTEEVAGDGGFAAALALEYQEAARREIAKQDWNSAARFARQGRLALSGARPEPTDPRSAAVDQADSQALRESRGQLMAALDRHADRRVEACAQAQRSYEVWLDEASDNILGRNGSLLGGSGGRASAARTERARMQFAQALGACSGRVVAEAGTAAPSAAAASYAFPPIADDDGDRVLVDERTAYFGFNSARLDEAAREIARDVGEIAAEYDGVRVNLRGYTDTTGSAAYNRRLGERRAIAFARVLSGIGVEDIRVLGLGESGLAVPTGDDTREPLNRRVEIEIKATP